MKKIITFSFAILYCLCLRAQAEWEYELYEGIAPKHKHLGWQDTFEGTTLDSSWKKSEAHTYSLDKGALTIKSSHHQYTTLLRTLPIDATKDYEIVLTLRSLEKTSGLVWGANHSSQFEFGYLNLTPHYFIRATRNGDITDMFKPYTQAPAVIVKDEFVTFVVRKIGLKSYFFLNGTRMYSMPFFKWYGQAIGILVPPQSSVEVQEIKVYSLSRATKSTDYAMAPMEISTSDRLIQAPTDNRPPLIRVTSPTVGRELTISELNKTLIISGEIVEESGIFEVLVNEYEAKVENNQFSAQIPLAIGTNTITIKAKDVHQNEGTYTFYVQREQMLQAAQSPTQATAIQTTGRCFLLLIGIQDYTDAAIPDLDNPIEDATTLAEILKKSYTFQPENTRFLKNATRNEITKELDRLLDIVQPDDNVLIFYAGHGYWDERLQQGYWFPSDAKRDNRGTWLPNSDIKDYIKAFRAKHTLLITDACFSGSIFKTREAFTATVANQELYKLPSRKAMTSGAMKAVPDNSVFLKYLVKRLEENTDSYLSAEQLFASFKTAVINNSSNHQVPQYGVISDTGDEGGDFIFIKKP